MNTERPPEPPGPPAIRRLGAGDLGLMRALLAMFGEAFGEQDTYTGNPPRNQYLRDLLGKNDFVVLAAMVQGEVAGGLAAYVLPKFEQERSEVYVYDLAVAKPFRRRGIATLLIEECTRLAAARGAYVVFIQADRADLPAASLYAKLGTQEEVLHFDIDVRHGPGD